MATPGGGQQEGQHLGVGVAVGTRYAHLISYNRNLYGLQSFGIICKRRSPAQLSLSLGSLHEVVKQLRIRHAAASPVSAASGSP